MIDFGYIGEQKFYIPNIEINLIKQDKLKILELIKEKKKWKILGFGYRLFLYYSFIVCVVLPSLNSDELGFFSTYFNRI